MTAQKTEPARSRLWHIGLTVSDLLTTLEFYTSVLGLTVEYLQEEQSKDFDRLTANSGTHVRVAWATDGAVVLQFIEYLAGGGGAAKLSHRRVGTPHLSFYVDDVDAAYARLAARGDIELPDSVTDIGEHGRSFYVTDPDGVPVELWQSVGAPRDQFNRALISPA
jgi:catechol 2,3-dioxygenase-like lactoylglutathione lyase family enzyme